MSDSVGRSRPLELVSALAAGLLFAVGLAVSGMTQPAKVVGFLDVTGDWDPSLAFVMAGAVAVYFLAQRWIRRRPAPALAPAFEVPSRDSIDRRLVIGAAVFGVGWGLGGFCPGPGIAALGAGSLHALVFVIAMAAGMLIFGALENAPSK